MDFFYKNWGLFGIETLELSDVANQIISLSAMQDWVISIVHLCLTRNRVQEGWNNLRAIICKEFLDEELLKLRKEY